MDGELFCGTGSIDTELCACLTGGIVSRGLHDGGRCAPALALK